MHSAYVTRLQRHLAKSADNEKALLYNLIYNAHTAARRSTSQNQADKAAAGKGRRLDWKWATGQADRWEERWGDNGRRLIQRFTNADRQRELQRIASWTNET